MYYNLFRQLLFLELGYLDKEVVDRLYFCFMHDDSIHHLINPQILEYIHQ